MKAGLAQLIFAIKALQNLEVKPKLDPVIFINTDEEVGSGDSEPHIRKLARQAKRAFVLEPSFGSQGMLKTTRKGVGRFTVRIRGQAGHAGISPQFETSAILEMSYQIQRLFELNDHQRGITINVGTIDGGLAPNVIAPQAVALVDARVPTTKDAEEITQAIHKLTPKNKGVSINVTGGFGRPPLEATPRNQALWRKAANIASRLGIELEQAAVGGASDGNTTSLYTATLDGLGAVGEGAHSPHEHVVIPRMPERAALLAMLLLED
jgi:glutamate carboxypeptidase